MSLSSEAVVFLCLVAQIVRVPELLEMGIRGWDIVVVALLAGPWKVFSLLLLLLSFHV